MKDRVQRILQEMVTMTMFHDTGFRNNSYRLTAALYYKKRLVCVGYNSTKTHPTQLQYGRNENSCHLHAEVDCLIKAQKLLDVDQMKKTIMFVARGYRKGEWAMACPCTGCQSFIKDIGIRTVYYTISENTYGVWHP